MDLGRLVVAWFACVGCGAGAAAVLPNPYPGVATAYLVQVNGRDLWGAALDRALPAASLVKMMTASIIADAQRDDEIVTVSAGAAAADGARIGLRAGERARVSMLLTALLMRSANDACRALAEWHAGSERAFVAGMNARARALGLADTRFDDPCGLGGRNERSTVHDLARLARVLLAQPALAALVATEEATLRTEGGRRFTVRNTNAMLGRIPGVRGVKTGTTRLAGRCLLVVAERGATQVLVVLLDAGDRWWDAVAIIEHAFEFAARGDDGPRH